MLGSLAGAVDFAKLILGELFSNGLEVERSFLVHSVLLEHLLKPFDFLLDFGQEVFLQTVFLLRAVGPVVGSVFLVKNLGVGFPALLKTGLLFVMQKDALEGLATLALLMLVSLHRLVRVVFEVFGLRLLELQVGQGGLL